MEAVEAMRLLLLVLLLLPEVHGEKGKLHVAPQDDKDLKDVSRAGGKASIYISITVTYTHDKSEVVWFKSGITTFY